MIEPTTADIDRCIETIERTHKRYSGDAGYRRFLQTELFCLREVKTRLEANSLHPAVKAITFGSKTVWTIAVAGTLTTTMAGMINVKNKPTGPANWPRQISRG